MWFSTNTHLVAQVNLSRIPFALQSCFALPLQALSFPFLPSPSFPPQKPEESLEDIKKKKVCKICQKTHLRSVTVCSAPFICLL